VSPREEKIFNINSEKEFIELALDTFNFQYEQNTVYKQWCSLLNKGPANVKGIEEIPFLPISFFKEHKIVSGKEVKEQTVFTSSSTTSQIPSKHYVKDITLYEKSFIKGFELFYGPLKNYCILALLPGYLERTGSSLVYMCDRFIKDSRNPLSGFFLRDHDTLVKNINKLKTQKQKTLLIGVSYALLDLAEKKIELDDNFIVMETGGMKGTRKEMLKPELHSILKKGFGVKSIHSEYGMTELLSQAYSKGDGKFTTPPWMRFLTREVTDPLSIRKDYKTGGINVIDLANLYSCSFIATQDLGRLDANGHLELMGRYDNSDIRGCNLMLET
jgi:hypothetical protein